MKIHILFPVTKKNKGGGNQFLRLLQNSFIEKGVYSGIEDADFVLFNSHQDVRGVINAKKKYPDKIFVHRVDGPMKLYNTMSDRRDDIVYTCNKYLADATIFQSDYSRRENYRLGLGLKPNEAVIFNAVDSRIYRSLDKEHCKKGEKIKIFANSWSTNINKGFDVYKYLDDSLDFSKFEMTFVGNSLYEYKNIKMLSPLDSQGIARALNDNDIYISASKNECCSNAIIEAISCGIPVVVHNSGGNPEIMQKAQYPGLLFEEKTEIKDILDKILNNYDNYIYHGDYFGTERAVNEYIDFLECIKDIERKKFSLRERIKIECEMLKWKYV